MTDERLVATALSLQGGASSDLMLPITWLQGILNEALMSPIVKPLATFIARFIIIMFITAEIMAYLGWIGERGEGLYEWASDHERELHKWFHTYGWKPQKYLRDRLHQMLESYKNLPPKIKFASAVSTGVTAFPLVMKTTIWAGSTALVTLLIAEILAFVGILGDPGEGLNEWIEDGEAEPLVHTFRRGTAELRRLLRHKLKISELVSAWLENMKNDQVFWIGFTVGGIACVTLPRYYG